MPKAPSVLLNMAQDWQLMVDLGRQLKFTLHIARMTQRSDIILISETAKNVIMLELTGLWEDRMINGFKMKENCKGFVSNCHKQGWKMRCLPVEVGYRSFAGQSLCKIYCMLYSALQERGGEKPSITVQRPQWETPSDSESKDLIHGTLLGLKLKPDEPQLDQLGEGVWCCETWNTQRPQDTPLMTSPSLASEDVSIYNKNNVFVTIYLMTSGKDNSPLNHQMAPFPEI